MLVLFDKILQYMQFPFVRYGLIVGVLIALCSSLLGVTLVLKRFSYIGDGLSHLAFGVSSVMTVFGLFSDMIVVLPITILTAVLLLKGGSDRKIKGDAAIAMLSVGALAIGYLAVNLFSSSSNLTADVCSTLFGSTSILTLSKVDVGISLLLSVIVIFIFIVFYNKIFAVTFDEDFATATGINASRYNLLIAVIIAVIIVLALKLVGSLLISALVIFPTISAMRLFKTFKSVTISSAIISVLAALLGMMIAILFGTPVGSTIVVINIFVFILFSILGYLFRIGGRI